jgi:hypothetical protein
VQSTAVYLMFMEGLITRETPYLCAECGHPSDLSSGLCAGCIGVKIVSRKFCIDHFGSEYRKNFDTKWPDPPIKLDAAIFADTGEEPEAVYRHLEWLQSLNGPPILVRSVGRLGDDLVNGRNSTGGRFASIPAFTTKDEGGTVGITRRQCSKG